MYVSKAMHSGLAPLNGSSQMCTAYIFRSVVCLVKDIHGWAMRQHDVDCRMRGDWILGWSLFGNRRSRVEAVYVTRVGKGPVLIFGLPGRGVDLGEEG